MLEDIFISGVIGCVFGCLFLVFVNILSAMYEATGSKLLLILVILVSGSFWISLLVLVLTLAGLV